MISKQQAEDSAQGTEIVPGEEGSASTGDIAVAWQAEFSKELTWDDLTRWLSEAG